MEPSRLQDDLQGGLGWHPDVADPHDFARDHEEVVRLLAKLKPSQSLPETVDWREFCHRPPHQKGLGSSAAFACLALVRYFECRSTGRLYNPSARFVYKTSRRILRWQGDSGSTFRATWKAICKFGVPDERVWPYDPARFDEEPDAFVYASAQELAPMYYVRLDARGRRGKKALETVKSFLAAGFPSVMGFCVPASVNSEAEIPMPSLRDEIFGGHAVLAVGYDDTRRTRAGRGAILICNSWGPHWGEEGFGWLPYAYVQTHLASDFWTVVRPEWLASEEFQNPV